MNSNFASTSFNYLVLSTVPFLSYLFRKLNYSLKSFNLLTSILDDSGPTLPRLSSSNPFMVNIVISSEETLSALSEINDKGVEFLPSEDTISTLSEINDEGVEFLPYTACSSLRL